MHERTPYILYIAHERKLGGASLSLLTLMEEMKKRGYKVAAVVPTSRCPMAQKLRELDVPIISVFFAWWQMPKDWNRVLKIAFRLLFVMERWQVSFAYHKINEMGMKVEVVHTNSSVTDFGARLAKRIGCKHIWHFREYGDCDYNLEYLLTREKTLHLMNANAERVIFISKDLYAYFEDYFEKAKCRVIYNGISAVYFQKKEYKERQKVIFLIAGNLHRNKQQMTVLKAAKELKDRKYNNFEVWIAGASSSMKDSKQYEKELNAYISENGLTNIKVLGRISDMIELRRNTDVEIVASKREAFGRVTIEAMFSGMPVIGSASGANIELITPNVNGELFESENYIDLAERMEKFLNNQNEIKRLGERAFVDACNFFTAEHNADKIEELYREVIQ